MCRESACSRAATLRPTHRPEAGSAIPGVASSRPNRLQNTTFGRWACASSSTGRRAPEPGHARACHWPGYLLLTLGRLEEGRSQLERAEELKPGYSTAPFCRACTLGHGAPAGGDGRSPAGPRATDPGPWRSAATRAWLAIVHHRAGDPRLSRELLAEVERAEAFSFMVGGGYAGLGEDEAALRALEDADYEGIQVLALRYDPVFDPLRDDPRYRELIRELNRQWGLNRTEACRTASTCPLAHGSKTDTFDRGRGFPREWT